MKPGHVYRPHFEPTVRAIALLVSIAIALATPVLWYWKIAVFLVTLYVAMKLARRYVMGKYRQWYPTRAGGGSNSN
jgi:hypothetical protein